MLPVSTEQQANSVSPVEAAELNQATLAAAVANSNAMYIMLSVESD